MPDYIPTSDADFRLFLTNWMTYGAANATAMGVTTADFTAIGPFQTAFNTSMDVSTAAQAAAQAAVQGKEDARAAAEVRVRNLTIRLQSLATCTDAHKAALGITVRDATRTPAGVPTTRPVGMVDSGDRLQHTIAWRDESTPNSRARPAGVRACEIWCCVKAAGAAPPASPDEMTYLATDTATPYLAEFDGADAGKTAWYWLRWVNTRGEVGPWSEAISATIGA